MASEYDKPESPESQHLELGQLQNSETRPELVDYGQSPWKTVVSKRKIVLFCLFANIGALMYGFDNLVLSLALSMVPFERRFGELVNGEYIIPTYWQYLWNALAQMATMLGSTIGGPAQDRFGRRISFGIAGALSAAGVAVVYTSSTPGTYLAGKIINGLAMGMCLTTGQTYISEITPAVIRGIALSFFTFCMNLGYMIAASVALSRVAIMEESAYKVIFAAGWAWPGLLLVCFMLVPESPYYLVMKGDLDKAKNMLQRLNSKTTDISTTLQKIVSLNEEEKINSAATKEASFFDCFRGDNWRRTRIILYCNGLSQVIGSTFMSNGPYFLVQAGMSPSRTAMMIEIGIGFGIASSLVTSYLMLHYGRRSLVLFGVGLSTFLFTVMGIAGCFPSSSAALWVVGIFLQLSWWTYGPAIGTSMALAGEISAMRLRAKSLAIGFTFNYFFSTIWNVAVPYLYNQDEANLGGKIGWIFAGMGFIALAVIFLEFPETKDRTFVELDEMFHAGVPTRSFKTYPSSTDGEKQVNHRPPLAVSP